MSVNIVLLCAGGMSTSILMKRIEKAAVERNFCCEVNAYGVHRAKDVVPDADIVLVGPQVRFHLESLQKTYPDKEISVIDMKDYGTMNGDNVIDTVIRILKIAS